MEHFVYVLCDPINEVPKYIGITNNAYVRFKQHISCRDTNEFKNDWISDLKRNKMVPIMKIIETVADEQAARDREKHWIEHHQSLGIELLNIQISGHTSTSGKTLLVYYWRIRRAMTVKRLAETANVSSATIVKIEKNSAYIPRSEVIHNLANALSISVDELLVDESEEQSAA